MGFERYWIFAACCAIVVGLLLRLLLRERVSLQHSLAFLLFMLGVVTTAVFPGLTSRLGRLMGFTLPSNFFFAILIGVLVLLHVGTIIALSRLEARTIALTQELGLVQEQMSRLAGGDRRRPLQPEAPPPGSAVTDADKPDVGATRAAAAGVDGDAAPAGASVT